MTDGHGVSRRGGRDQYAWRILTQVEAGTAHTQRSLARSTGIALGLTNLVLKHLIRTGLVRIARVQRNRVRYLITPAGIAEKARMSRAYFASTTRFYAEARDRVRERFRVLSAAWPHPVIGDDAEKRIVFYGAGEVAEIGYVCLQETDLKLVATIDGERRKPVFGAAVHPPSWLDDIEVWRYFGVIVVMSFYDDDLRRAHERLASINFPASRVFSV